LRLRRWPIDVTRGPVACNRRNLSVRSDLADAIVSGVGDVEVAVRSERERRRRVERRCCSGAVCKSFAAARECSDVSVKRELANAITLPRVGDVDRSVSSNRNSKRIGENEWRSIACNGCHVSLPTQRRRYRLVFITVDKKSSCAAENDEQDDGEDDFAHLVEKGFRLREQLFDARNVTADVQTVHQ